MKKYIIVILLMTITVSSFAMKKSAAYLEARKSGAIARIQIHIIDDFAHEVPNAEVTVFMGMNFRPLGYYLKGVTNAKGIYIVEGKTCGDEIVIDVAKHGYYSSTKRLCFAEMGAEHNVEHGRWQPVDQVEKITLRRVDAPVNLIVFDKLIDVAQTNTWLGFDMKEMDFVKPFGVGTNPDFKIKVDWDGLPAWESRHCSAEIRFTEDKTGSYRFGNVAESRFPYSYAAVVSSPFSERSIRVVDRNGDPHATKIPFPKGVSFVIRTRSVADKHGKIKTANYGSINRFEVGPSRRGVALVHLSYVFNPTPNDTNLEPKQ